MSSIINIKYDKSCIQTIKDWGFGQNWPVVYIFYNDTKAYVGETLDAARRTEEHFHEDEFNEFDSLCMISNKTFNKSVILDLESFLIKYMSAEETKILTNGNAGILDHNYFYKEAYIDDFKEIWEHLIKIGIVKNSLLDIENSELFKYSPYKTLNHEQQDAAYKILQQLSQINNANVKSMITVLGGAGTGKTILAVYLIKLLSDISADVDVWRNIEDPEESVKIQKVSKTLKTIRKIGFVVPMEKLRRTMKTIFKSISGLSEDMVIAPEEVVKTQYDILIVDEAHRLYRRKNLPGSHLFLKFDAVNKQLMADKFTGTEKDLTELDWIIRSSRMQVLFYDEFQAIRVTDIGHQRFSEICKPHLFRYIELFSQMRCKGGNGYYEYIRKVIESRDFSVTNYKKVNDYELKVFDNVEDLFSLIKSKNDEENLCKVVTGPGWSINEDIKIGKSIYHWASGKKDPTGNVIYSIHKIQGFDLNYAGVIFGREIYYDDSTKSIAINKKELKDNFTKSNGEADMLRFILNIYITLMTRGIYGTYVYAIDDKLRDYLRKFLS